MTDSARGYVYAGVVVLIWSGFILISRAGGASALTPWDIIAIRYGAAAIVLLPLWLIRERFSLSDVRVWALAGVGGIGYALLAFNGFERAPAVHAAILLPGLLPFLIALAAWPVLGERVTRGRIGGLALLAVGVFALGLDSYRKSDASVLGDAMFVGASACWALYTVLARRWALNPWHTTIATALITAALYLPVYVVALPKAATVDDWQMILAQAIYQGVLAMIVQMVLYMRTVALIGPTRLGVFMGFVPVIAGLAAVPLLNESLTTALMIGLFFVSAGSWFSLRSSLTQSPILVR